MLKFSIENNYNIGLNIILIKNISALNYLLFSCLFKDINKETILAIIE
jgi:hypothetical protein